MSSQYPLPLFLVLRYAVTSIILYALQMFPFEVQFGHAGALARGTLETADAKNRALTNAGAVVPANFDAFDECIRETYQKVIGLLN